MSGDAPVVADDDRDLHWAWYLFGLALYIGLALGTLALRDNVVLLNWLVGPLFPFVVLYLIPTGVRALLGGSR